MSMLSSMCDQLRDLAVRFDGIFPENAAIMRRAADTIWQLRSRCNDLQDENERLNVQLQDERIARQHVEYERNDFRNQLESMENELESASEQLECAADQDAVDRLEAEVKLLRDQLDAKNHNAIRNAREYNRMCNDNAKLRELGTAMLMELFAAHAFLCKIGYLTAVDGDKAKKLIMRCAELGIEVDE